MENSSEAQKLFLQGYNCSQSVFAANASALGMDFETALKVSIGLGGGVGRLRQVCGAFSACAMLAGMLKADDSPDQKQKEVVYTFVQKLAEDFKKENGSIICAEILKLKENQTQSPTPDARTAEYYKNRPCLAVVGFADKMAKSFIEQKD